MTASHTTKHSRWASFFSFPSSSNFSSSKANDRRSTSTVGLCHFQLHNTSISSGEQQGRVTKGLDIVEALRLSFRQMRRRIKDMVPVRSSSSSRSDRRPFLYSELDDSDTWTNESSSTHRGDTQARPQLGSRPLPRLPNQGQMTPASTYQVLHRIGQTFSHVQYAVCGTAAMLAYGNNARSSTQVSIMCPAYARDVIKSWAAATSGMMVYPGEPNIIGIADKDGDTWAVEIQPVPYDDSFETLSIVGLGFGGDRALTKVLTMPALVNQIAAAYALGGPAAEEVCLDDLADDLVWLLKQIRGDDRPEQQLTMQRVPAAGNQAFWLDFTTAYPALLGLFYDAGFRVGGEETPSKVEAPLPAQPNQLPLREGCRDPRRKRRPTVGFGPSLRRRLGEGPNMTRAEARKVMSELSYLRRSSGRLTSGQMSRPRRRSEGSFVKQSMSALGHSISRYVFGKVPRVDEKTPES